MVSELHLWSSPPSSCHKTMFSVIFDPPSFLLTHSIIVHLWRLTKLEKKSVMFLPPRAPSNKLQWKVVPDPFTFGDISSISAQLKKQNVQDSPMAVAITAFKDNKIEKNMQDLFQDLIVDDYISPESKTLCVDTPTGSDVSTLREIGVSDAVGISKKASKPLVISSDSRQIPFGNNSFDFVFSGDGALEKSPNPSEFAAEIARTLKPEGFAAFHVMAKHTYSSNSFVDLFKFCCKVVKVNDIEGFDSSMPHIREIVVKKEGYGIGGDSDFGGKCSVPRYKQELVKNAEPLIEEEPLKPYNNMPSVWKLFDKMPENYRAFVHWCVDEGMEEGEFSEGREDLVYRDNVALIVTGTLYERDVQELPEKCHPLGMFDSITLVGMNFEGKHIDGHDVLKIFAGMKVFDNIPKWNIVAWTCLIARLVTTRTLQLIAIRLFWDLEDENDGPFFCF